MRDSVADLSGTHSFSASASAPNVTTAYNDRDDAAGDLPAVSASTLEVKTTPVATNPAESSAGAQSPIDPLSQVS